MNLEQLRYPIGRWEAPAAFPDPDQISTWIGEIAAFPQRLKTLVEALDTAALSWPYRPGGWSVKQVVHHCADSHLNAWFRFKLALTEERPTIKPYQEGRWAQTADGTHDDVADSLLILKGLHGKLATLLSSLDAKQLRRSFYHPEHDQHFGIAETISNYAWHSNHHLAHVQQALASEGEWL
jgi:hypothetical protein